MRLGAAVAALAARAKRDLPATSRRAARHAGAPDRRAPTSRTPARAASASTARPQRFGPAKRDRDPRSADRQARGTSRARRRRSRRAGASDATTLDGFCRRATRARQRRCVAARRQLHRDATRQPHRPLLLRRTALALAARGQERDAAARGDRRPTCRAPSPAGAALPRTRRSRRRAPRRTARSPGGAADEAGGPIARRRDRREPKHSSRSLATRGALGIAGDDGGVSSGLEPRGVSAVKTSARPRAERETPQTRELAAIAACGCARSRDRRRGAHTPLRTRARTDANICSLYRAQTRIRRRAHRVAGNSRERARPWQIVAPGKELARGRLPQVAARALLAGCAAGRARRRVDRRRARGTIASLGVGGAAASRVRPLRAEMAAARERVPRARRGASAARHHEGA